MKTLNSKTRRALLVSASFPLSALLAGPVQAEQTVTVNAATTATAVNTDIATKIATPDPDLTIEITSAGTIANPGSPVTLNPAAGQGDGKINFTNAGSIGAVDKSGAITDLVGVTLNGIGKAGAGNTLDAANSGLITGGFSAGTGAGFGGTVSFANTGTVYGGVDLETYGDGSYSGSGTIRSGDLTIDALSTTTANKSGGVDLTGGNVKIVTDGDVASADGKVRGDVTGIGYATTDVTVGGVADDVLADGGGQYTTTNVVAAPEAGKTVTTLSASQTYGAGAATATIGAGGDVTNVQANGYTGATTKVVGKVSGDAGASIVGYNDTTNVTTETQDGSKVTTAETLSFTSVTNAKAAGVDITDSGEVGGNVSASGVTGATVTNAGKVGGSIDASTSGASIALDVSAEYSKTGKIVSIKGSAAPIGGAATIEVASGGEVDGGASASGVGGATVIIDGAVKGTTSAVSTGTSLAGEGTITYDGATPVAAQGTLTFTPVGGDASVAVSKGASAGAAFTNGDASATVTNAGTIGSVASVGATTVSAVSDRDLTTSITFDLSKTAITDGTATSATITTVESNVGGAAKVANSGNLWGNVVADGVGGATVTNSGAVFGTTTVASTGRTATDTVKTDTSVVTPAPVPPALAVTTTKNTTTETYDSAVTGGSVTGTYSGLNGALNFTGFVDGSIAQTANKDSTATITGSVFGDVSSEAGADYSESGTKILSTIQVIDTAGDGTQSAEYSEDYKSADSAGTSTVTIAGKVKSGASGLSGSVSSTGTTASIVKVNAGSEVTGSISSVGSGIESYTYTETKSGDQTVTGFTPVTNNYEGTWKEQSSYAGGDSSVALSGKVSVGGDLGVTGNSSATATIGASAGVGGGLYVYANSAFDGGASETDSYTRDTTTGIATASQLKTSSSAPAATAGNATATIDGTVGGDTYVSASRGDAKASVTGTAGNIQVTTGNSATTTSMLTKYAGKSASGATDFDTLVAPLGVTSFDYESASTATGGKATVVIDTASAFAGKTAATYVNAYGLGGASVSVSANSKVDGSIDASGLDFENSTFKSTMTYGPTVSYESSGTSTAVGAAGVVDNAGLVTGSVNARGRTAATVTNSGTIDGNVQAYALGYDSASSHTDSDYYNADPATHVIVDKATYTAVGGDAAVTNAASGVILGDVHVAGKTGTVTNNGIIAGTTYLGSEAKSYSDATTTTVGTGGLPDHTPPATLFTQTYTVNQNGLSGGFDAGGATIKLDNGFVKTSDISATINLNDGSGTFGDITAQTLADGSRATKTIVNLNGSGLLGDDTGVYVRGVETIKKEGAGTFLITGKSYVPVMGPGTSPIYTFDVGTFAINGGEVQLAVAPVLGGTDEFGVKGNITNNATLVLGTRVELPLPPVGGSIVGVGPEAISGVTVREVGDFAQSATGTLVVGMTPSLVRFGDVTIGTSGNSGEPLGVVTGGVNVPYFTTPANAGAALPTSRVDITGNLNLGGTVLVTVNRNSLYLDGDGYTLFTYTGTGDTASSKAVSSLSSPFVSFKVANDTAAKTVRLLAARSSYTSGATNPNAVAAAAGFDTALPAIVAKITADASGGAGFQTVSEIGYAQDLANIAAALDWRLNTAQINEVFNELSSAEFYGSLSAVNQNAAFGDTVNQLTNRRSYSAANGMQLASTGTLDQDVGTQLWINPFGNFARYGGTASGASPIHVTSYGAAFGLDFAYSGSGVAGIGGAYAENDIRARGTPETGRMRTWTIGAYVSQGFGPLYVNGLLAYGMSRITTERDLPLLARTMRASFHGNQFDASLEVGYDFAFGNFMVTPFGKLALRDLSFDAFNETGGGGAGLAVAKRSKSIFTPVIGAKIGGLFGDPEKTNLRPFLKGYYTFRGDAANDRTVRYLGGGDSFVLRGVKPEDFGTIEGGVEAMLNHRVSVSLSGGYSFGGHNDIATARGGISLRF